MKILIVLLFIYPFGSLAQEKEGSRLPVMVRVVLDSGTAKGYFIAAADSTILLSPSVRYTTGNTMRIEANNIRELHFKTRAPFKMAVSGVAFVVGFILTAGLTKNGGDVNDDGKTSFFELIFTAIEGSTSSNRRRRNTALIVGGAGGTLAIVAYLLSDKKLSLVFPLNNRNEYYNTKKAEIYDHVKF